MKGADERWKQSSWKFAHKKTVSLFIMNATHRCTCHWNKIILIQPFCHCSQWEISVRPAEIKLMGWHGECVFFSVFVVDLREVVFVIQSQRNSFHVRQAEKLRKDLLLQTQTLQEVMRFHFLCAHIFTFILHDLLTSF